MAAIVSALASRCVLLVSGDVPDSTDHCAFAGSDTQCGACVASSCQADVDACCSEPSCDGALRDLESCASRHDAACGSLHARTSGGGAEGKLASCVALHCAGVCIALAGHGMTSCKESAESDGAACSCTVGATTNDFICSDAAYAETLCCAPAGWPGIGLECSCKPLACNPTNDGCFCSLEAYAPTERACQGASCCVSIDTCTCRAMGCFPFETKVNACSVAAVSCPEGQSIVPNGCSLRSGG